MKRSIYIVLVAGLVWLLSSCSSSKTERPNILFILSDDHSVNAIGCYNNRLSDEVRTPNIDHLAAEGMLFSQTFCTNSICSPSRATILTGKYSHKNGVYCLNQDFDNSQMTSASVLHDAGYQTAVYGKWHLKSRPSGFDDYSVLDEQGRYWNPRYFEPENDSMVQYDGWVDDVTAEMTMNFIKSRKKDKPFFVMCHFKSVHDPWDTRQPYDTCYQDQFIPEPDNLCDTYKNRGEASKRTTLKLEMLDQRTFRHEVLNTDDTCEQRKFVYQQYIKAFLRGANVLDENVGKVVRFLKEQGLDENTIVIYSSDQGHFLGEHGFFSKRFMYDESMQMPLIIKWPGKIKPGSINSDLVANIDFAPTIIDIAGLSIPKEMQGESLRPLLEGCTPENWRDAIYYRYWQHLLHRDVAAHYGIRTDSFKLIYYYGENKGLTDFPPTPPEWELFDLTNDPNEMNNVYSDPEYANSVNTLKTKMDELKEYYQDWD
ncbi:sulfatase [uncultured Draconibacterium sp.]|uniref:sulfatase family protein n=1 Tax=uncultured Draconibacterium sp. TaxID=1573823 RepID=UPI0029C75672|nr:sulfatase [uncultured Draconibacterium sp.]